MHEAAFELIEIPHVRMSGKNSADIRMVVDALDLCYTKAHVDTFVIISGDSDFSPLVSKLRENDKTVIGVGVKKSTSDLLIANCDEFIYYDDLVRGEARRRHGGSAGRAKPAAAPAGGARTPKSREPSRTTDKKQEALDLVMETIEALVAERGAGREDLGLDGQAGAEAPQARLQRVLLRLPLLRQAARGAAGAASCSRSSTTRSRAA